MSPCGTSETDATWCNVFDVPGLIMAGVAWAMTLYCLAALVVVGVSLEWPDAVLGVYAAFTALALWAHAATMACDPGAVPRAARPLPSAEHAETICGRCDAYKPPNSHHCRICGRCVVRMDHHCPWLNNCIGAKNQKLFILFLVYTWLQCTLAIGLVGAEFASCEEEKATGVCFPGMLGGITLSLVVVCLLMLVFVSSMLYNQAYALRTGAGTIDRMKHRSARSLGLKPISLKGVFGGGSVLFWPLPLPAVFDNEDSVLGFVSGSNSVTGNDAGVEGHDVEVADEQSPLL
mmetsp:Transcript_58954/g.118382  ORF Transcript_58954/g.118382 Transcript_58954/m.118382 type:complete len:290 (+) Transcript_58954:79-948(+)